MSAGKLWMVRSAQGCHYHAFYQRGIVAIGWRHIAAVARPGVSREILTAHYRAAQPEAKAGSIRAGVAQVWRFINEIQNGDGVLTYDPASRHNPAGDDAAMSLVRPVAWRDVEICRDDLSAATQKSLNAILTVFAVSPAAQAEIVRQLRP